MKKIFFALILFYSFAFSNELPDLGSSSDSIISTFQEKKIRMQLLYQANQSPTVLKDPEINAYMERLGKKLMHGSSSLQTDPISFFIIQDQTINAFAMLGRVIGVHTGLIYAANSESELASVLAHEIAHITQKHLPRIIEAQSKDTFKTSLAMVFALLVARSNPQLANAAMQTAQASAVQSTLDFTREHEKEADREGLKILSKSGFDERAFISFFKSLDEANKFSSGAAPSFLRTHPITLDRISDIEDRLTQIPYKQREDELSFDLVRAKLQAFEGNPSTSISLLKTNIRNKSGVNQDADHFALAYAYLRGGKLKQAQDSFDQIKHLQTVNPMVNELKANLLLKSDKVNELEKHYKQALLTFPNYKAYIYGLAHLYLSTNQIKKAMLLLEEYESIQPYDANLYKLLATAHSANGSLYLEHKNLSEYFYYNFDLKEAANQMGLAIKSVDANFYDKARAEQRLKEIQGEITLYDNIQ